MNNFERVRRFNKLSAICFFLSSLALIAPLAKAAPEQGAKKCSDSIDNDGDGLYDGDDPDCGSDSTPSPTSLSAVIVDSMGKVLGAPTPEKSFDAWSDIFVKTPFDIAGKMNSFKWGLSGKQGLFFDQPNCSGNGFVEAPQAESLFAEVIQAGRNPDVFYLPDLNTSETTVTVLSMLDVHGTNCIEQNGPMLVYPAVIFDIAYEPPLKITLR